MAECVIGAYEPTCMLLHIHIHMHVFGTCSMPVWGSRCKWRKGQAGKRESAFRRAGRAWESTCFCPRGLSLQH